MTALNYYRWSLALPIVIPACALPFWQSIEPPFLGILLITYFMYGAAPYLLWAIYTLIQLRDKDADDARGLSYQAPLQMTPLVWVDILVCSVFVADAMVDSSILFFIFLATFATLFFGYLWVWFVNGSLKTLQRWDIVRDAPYKPPPLNLPANRR